jgi:hypothetical protein
LAPGRGHQYFTKIGALGVLEVHHVLAVVLGLDGVHDGDAGVARDGKIAVFAITHALDDGHGLFLRVFLAHRAGLGFVAVHLEYADAEVVEIGQVGHALLDARVAQLDGVVQEDGGDAEQAADQGYPQLLPEGKVAHCCLHENILVD